LNRPFHRSLRLRYLAALAAPALLACFGKSTETRFTNVAPQPPVDPVVQRPFEPAQFRIRLLLGWQYRNAVRHLLGEEAAAAVTPPPDTTVNGWDAIGAAQLSLSPTAVDLYEGSAQQASAIAFGNASLRDSILGCAPGTIDPSCSSSCMRGFVSRFGRRAWRRALTEEEVATWAAVGASAAAAYQDFYKGAAFVAAGLLQSPDFLYVVEVGQANGDGQGRLKLSGYEVASRLAFFLTGSTPSNELLSAAEAGELDTADGIRSWARALLQQPSARDAIAQLFDELLQLRELSQLTKDPRAFPAFNSALAAAMRDETQNLLGSLIWDETGDFRRFFDADYTFVNRDLASLYGLGEVPPSGFTQVSLPEESRRGGFLGQGSFLSLMAHQATTSPTLRGKFVREKLLCQNIPPPPPDVDINLPNSEGKTTRQKLLAHQQNPSCAGCHVLMDDIGLGLENFDAIGAFRTSESGQPIDASSTFDELGAFTGARQLGLLLSGQQQVTHCLARNLFRAATGHVDGLGESGPLNDVHARFGASGFRLQELLVEIAASDAFRFGSAPAEGSP